MDRWPQWDGGNRASLDAVMFTCTSTYGARVVFAAGSFNWRVRPGDLTQVSEFGAGGMRLAAESSAAELTWSRSSLMPLDQVRALFGGHVNAQQRPHATYLLTARRLLVAFLVINLIPLVLATGATLSYTLLGAAAIYLPAYFLDKLDAQS